MAEELSTPPRGMWVPALGYDPKEEFENLTPSDSGVVTETPSAIAKALFAGGSSISFERAEINMNAVLSLDASSEEEGIGINPLGLVRQSFEDRAFAKNSTPLYEALSRREWRQAMVFLRNGSFISRNLADGTLLSEPRVVSPQEQLRTWVSLYESDGRLLWRRLPVHDALIRGAPVDLICAMLQLHPSSAEAKDWDGNLPLHLAMQHNADEAVVEMILQEYPQAVEIINDTGKLPQECVSMRGESSLRSEILQSYISSAKQITTQEVPKLKDKLFEVNKTIEAAKSELRLAKVELGMIKEQEKMRIQSKEKEESRMKEEVTRLRNELEVLRCEREELASEKEQWGQKKKEPQNVLVISDSDSDDSQRSWIANEFNEMVSELEKTTMMAKQRKSIRHSSAGGPSRLRPGDPARGASRSMFRKKFDPFKGAIYQDLKEVKTDATETTSDFFAEQLSSEENVSKASSKDSEENASKASSKGSIRSIREELKQTRKELDSRSNSEDGVEQQAQRRPKMLGSRSNMDDRGQELTERIRKLESRSGSEDKGDELEERLRKLESRSNSEDGSARSERSVKSGHSVGRHSTGKDPEGQVSSEYGREHIDSLSALDKKLSRCLHGNVKDGKLVHEGREPEGMSGVSSKGSAAGSREDNEVDFDLTSTGSKDSATSSRSDNDQKAGLADRQSEELNHVGSKCSAGSSKSGRRSFSYSYNKETLPNGPSAGVLRVGSKGSVSTSRSGRGASSMNKEAPPTNRPAGVLQVISKGSASSSRSKRGDVSPDSDIFTTSQPEEEHKVQVVTVTSKSSDSSSRSGRSASSSTRENVATCPPLGTQQVQVVTVTSKSSVSSSGSQRGTSSHNREIPVISSTERPIHVGLMTVNSRGSNTSSKSLGATSSTASKLEAGLFMVAQKSSAETRWNCNSMADDLTCQEDDDDALSNSQFGMYLPDPQERWKPEEQPIAESGYSEEITTNKFVLVGECRDEMTDQFTPNEESRDDDPQVQGMTMAARQGHVTFADEAEVCEEEARDSFSPQFRRFDDQVDKAMSRISRKTHIISRSGRHRSRRRSYHHGSRGRARESKSDQERHICVTAATDNKIEILSSVSPYHEESVRSSNSVTSEPRTGEYNALSDWEHGYASEI